MKQRRPVRLLQNAKTPARCVASTAAVRGLVPKDKVVATRSWVCHEDGRSRNVDWTVIGALLTRALSSALLGVVQTDVATFDLLTLLLSAVAATAAYMPARWAMKVDPMVALRYE